MLTENLLTDAVDSLGIAMTLSDRVLINVIAEFVSFSATAKDTERASYSLYIFMSPSTHLSLIYSRGLEIKWRIPLQNFHVLWQTVSTKAWRHDPGGSSRWILIISEAP